MKILITGNSQAAALRKAGRDSVPLDGVDLSYFVAPGGTGPHMTVGPDGRLQEHSRNTKAPPFSDPPGTEDVPMSQFDAIVISALGYVDGGVKFRGPFADGPFVAEFAPIDVTGEEALVSKACFREVHASLTATPGFRFAADLRKHFAGPIIVQPMPYPSAESRSSPTWATRQRYRDAIGFNGFLATLTDRLLADFCAEHAMTLLPRPPETIEDGPFTGMAYMREGDGVHPNDLYGKLVLGQIHAAAKALGAAG